MFPSRNLICFSGWTIIPPVPRFLMMLCDFSSFVTLRSLARELRPQKKRELAGTLSRQNPQKSTITTTTTCITTNKPIICGQVKSTLSLFLVFSRTSKIWWILCSCNYSLSELWLYFRGEGEAYWGKIPSQPGIWTQESSRKRCCSEGNWSSHSVQQGKTRDTPRVRHDWRVATCPTSKHLFLLAKLVRHIVQRQILCCGTYTHFGFYLHFRRHFVMRKLSVY